MTDAVKLLESWGLEVVLGETVDLSYHQFAGDDNDQRTTDMQRFIDDDSIKAIIAARGGYGTVRMGSIRLILPVLPTTQNGWWVLVILQFCIPTCSCLNYGVQRRPFTQADAGEYP